MNVLILSTQNPYYTSGIVAYNLYKGLKGAGHNTKVLTKLYGVYEENDFVSMETSFDVFCNKMQVKFKRVLNRLPFLSIKSKVKTDHEYHVQDFDQTVEYHSTRSILKKAKMKPDVIFYLFQQNYLTAKNLYELNTITGAPIYWYMMDTAPLTGLCHYSWNCDGYTKGCGSCPAIYSTNPNDQSAKNFQYKLKYLSKTNINIITPTEWQNKKAVESLLFKNNPIHKIILSIDPIVYDFVSKSEGKKKLGIELNRKVIFFGSTSVNDKRKGMRYLFEALEILKKDYPINQENILLMIAGNFDESKISLPFKIKNLGLLKNSEELAAAFHAADVFVCPSIEDSGPMMINQSIMTGTPVVSFKMGVSEDIVVTGKTGYRAKLMDSPDLAKGISYVLDLNKDAYGTLCLNSRELAINNFSFNAATEQILRLIEKDSTHG